MLKMPVRSPFPKVLVPNVNGSYFHDNLGVVIRRCMFLDSNDPSKGRKSKNIGKLARMLELPIEDFTEVSTISTVAKSLICRA